MIAKGRIDRPPPLNTVRLDARRLFGRAAAIYRGFRNDQPSG
jgi:hypothetical protein